MFNLHEVVFRLSDQKEFTVVGTPADTHMVNTNEPAYLLKDRRDEQLVVSKSSMESGRYQSRHRQGNDLTKAMSHLDGMAFRSTLG